MGVGGISDSSACSVGDTENDYRGIARGAVNHHPKSPWTKETVDRLLKLWSEGYSATQIGEKLGVSRNSVMGKLFRLDPPAPETKRGDRQTGGRTGYAASRPRQDPFIAKLKAKRATERYRNSIKAESREILRGNGTSVYSAAYRKHLPRVEMSKSELRAMLAQAVTNTAGAK